MLVFDHSVDTPSLPFNFPMSLPPSLPPSSYPPLLPSSSPVDHADADREQRAAGEPAGWGGSWPWGGGGGGRRGGGGPVEGGWDKRGNRRRGSGWVWARSRPPGAFGALLGCPPLPSPPEGPPGLLNVRARGGPRPHGPWSPSPGLPGSPPAAPQHTQRKLELPRPLLFPTFLLVAPIGSLWPNWWVVVQSWLLYFP